MVNKGSSTENVLLANLTSKKHVQQKENQIRFDDAFNASKTHKYKRSKSEHNEKMEQRDHSIS